MNSPADPLSLASATRIDALCDRFEAEWRAGRPTPIEELLTNVPSDQWEAALASLLRVELELCQRAGRKPEATDYELRFPGQSAVVADVFAEFARQATTDTSVNQVTTQ